MKNVLMATLLIAAQLITRSAFANKDEDKELKWLVPSVDILVGSGDSGFSILKIEVDVRKTGMDCYDKVVAGITSHTAFGDKFIPQKITGLKEGVIAILASLNGVEVCPNKQCGSKTARKSDWYPFENNLTVSDLVLFAGYSEAKGICSNPISNVAAEIGFQDQMIAKEIDQKGKALLEIKIVYFKKGSLEKTILGSTTLDLSYLKTNNKKISATIVKPGGSVLGQVQSRPGIGR